MATPFSIFSVAWENFKSSPSTRLSTVTDDFISAIDVPFKESKMFEVEDDIKKLLLLTKPAKIELKFPFPSVFINVLFTEEETGGVRNEENNKSYLPESRTTS